MVVRYYPFIIQRAKFVALTFEEFSLEFNPMKSQHVEEALHDVHQHQNPKGDAGPNWESYEECYHGSRLQGWKHDLVEEDFGKLTVSETQCPESQIRGCVTHGTQSELNSLDQLMYHDFSEVKLAVCRFLLQYL